MYFQEIGDYEENIEFINLFLDQNSQLVHKINFMVTSMK